MEIFGVTPFVLWTADQFLKIFHIYRSKFSSAFFSARLVDKIVGDFDPNCREISRLIDTILAKPEGYIFFSVLVCRSFFYLFVILN